MEIPRFKRKELNLQLVKRRGPGQRIAWIGLWAVWLINGLGGLVSLRLLDGHVYWAYTAQFFDVNLMYMLVQ